MVEIVIQYLGIYINSHLKWNNYVKHIHPFTLLLKALHHLTTLLNFVKFILHVLCGVYILQIH